MPTNLHRLLIAMFALCAAQACGSDGPRIPTEPTIPPGAFSFVSDTASPGLRSFDIVQLNETTTGQITVGLRANDFGSGFALFRGTIVYDSGVLKLINYGEGDFLKQGGAIASFSVTELGSNRVSIRIDRPSSLSPATGTGIVIALRFQASTLGVKGTSALQWDEPHAYTSGFSEQLQRTYGGTVTIR